MMNSKFEIYLVLSCCTLQFYAFMVALLHRRAKPLVHHSEDNHVRHSIKYETSKNGRHRTIILLEWLYGPFCEHYLMLHTLMSVGRKDFLGRKWCLCFFVRFWSFVHHKSCKPFTERRPLRFTLRVSTHVERGQNQTYPANSIHSQNGGNYVVDTKQENRDVNENTADNDNEVHRVEWMAHFPVYTKKKNDLIGKSKTHPFNQQDIAIRLYDKNGWRLGISV